MIVAMVAHRLDLDIAQAAELRPISEIAAELGLTDDDLIFYGKYKAKFGFAQQIQ